jgi:septal ring factor EnvC (AmiA/AmiB activator)
MTTLLFRQECLEHSLTDCSPTLLREAREAFLGDPVVETLWAHAVALEGLAQDRLSERARLADDLAEQNDNVRGLTDELRAAERSIDDRNKTIRALENAVDAALASIRQALDTEPDEEVRAPLEEARRLLREVET